MDKGQAHVALILIITLAAIVGGVLVVVFVLNDQSATPTSSTDPWNSGATIPGGTPGNIPVTIPSTPGTPSTGTGGIPGEFCVDAFNNDGTYDCAGTCVERTYLQGSLYDGFCDVGDFGVNLNCATFNYDETDCTSVPTSGTPTTPTTPTIPTTGGSGGNMDWLLEETPNVITESSMIADFVNSKMTTESEAYANYPPVECDLTATPFSQSGASQAVGLRTCNGDDEIVDLGVMDIYDVWKLDDTQWTWVSNPTAVVGHVYIIKARDGSLHRVEVVSINGEEITISWVSGV